MTVTARKYALLNRISPGVRQLAGLYLLELAVIFSWTLLLDTLLNLLSGNWFTLLPVSYFLAVTLLAWLEHSRTGERGQCPLEAFGLAEISLSGSRPTEWQTLRRLLFTPPLLFIFCIGLIPVPRTGKTILQMISGSMIVPLDIDMDPRPNNEIFRCRRKALMKVISYSMVSLMVAAVMILVPPELSRGETTERISSLHSLPEEDRELLAAYLEMRAIYPDSLEFRVRLASLYYRNNMEEDLFLELQQIRRLDPDHSILLLEQDLSVTMEDLMIGQDTTFSDSMQVTVIEQPEPPAEDTASRDTVLLLPDSVSLDLIPVSSDSIAVPVDSMQVIDSSGTDTIIEQDSLSLPVAEDSVPQTEIPYIIVTEDTSAVVIAPSTESAGDAEYAEPPETIEETLPEDTLPDETLPDETLPPETLPPDTQPESEGT